MIRSILGVLAAYLIGSLPWALWVGGIARGVDVREHGSGNLGATNVYRVLGPPLGLLVFALDAAKGALGVVVCAAIAGDSFPGGRAGAGLAGAVAAVLGHMFTAFAGFRGGKGAATTAGALLAVAPIASLFGLSAFVIAFVVSRRISVGSISAAVVMSVALWFVPVARTDRATAVVGTLVALLVIVRHAPNIGRLLRGEEPAFQLRRARTGAASKREEHR
ncbi:MAG: glycerol-3-phosphate 1-O-acyltransferase PlsY [Candidatus Eiseniibacteriota bacterium]